MISASFMTAVHSSQYC